MKTTINFKFEAGFICFFLAAILVLISTSCSSSLDDEPTVTSASSNTRTIDNFYEDGSATILILHNDPEYGRNRNYSERIGVSWKAFPNSEDNIDLYLKADGFMPSWSGENASNFLMDFNISENLAIIQPWPYIGNDGTRLTKDVTENIYTVEFQGKSYYMFNPVVINMPSAQPQLMNYRNGKPIKNITLLCDYNTYGTHIVNVFDPEDEFFYMYSVLPLPENGIERNKIYIYILDDDYNFFEYGRRAGNYAYNAASVYAASHPNEPDKYTLIEYSPENDSYLKIL